MGDKSPKATQKSKSQKDKKTDAGNKKKAAAAPKAAPKPAPKSGKK